MVLPLLATQISWVNLITDSAPALPMGLDPPMADVMARKPHRPTERVIDARIWAGVVEIGLVMTVATLMTIDLFLPGGLIEGTHDRQTARTAGFTVLVIARLFNALNARSETTSAFHHLFVDLGLWGALGLSALLQAPVVHVSMLNVAFGTVPVGRVQWLIRMAMGSVVLWFSELSKWVTLVWRR